jgi:hypothetical protein
MSHPLRGAIVVIVAIPEQVQEERDKTGGDTGDPPA